MKVNYLISAIIPVYNTPEKYLRECIQSVVNQTHKNIEIILVDDGSNKETSLLCDQLATEHSVLSVIHQKNSGPSIARSTGLQAVHGDFLTFVDSDDFLKPDAWELCIQKMEENSSDCLVFGWIDNSQGTPFDKKVTESDVSNLSSADAITMIASDNDACGGGYPWNKIWRVSSIRQANNGNIPLFDEKLFTYEDKEWIIRVLLGIDKVSLISDVLYNYRYVSTSLTNAADSWYRRQYNAYEAYDKIACILKTSNYKAYVGAVNFYFTFGMQDLIEQYRHPDYYGGLSRARKTKKCMYALCKRLHLKELQTFKKKIAWLIIRIWGKL